MNARFLLTAGVTTALLAITSLPDGAASPVVDEIEWRTDLKAAEQEARETGKPMLVVFRCEP